jgi:signal transduction histidine kinase
MPAVQRAQLIHQLCTSQPESRDDHQYDDSNHERACKWAASRVTIGSSEETDAVVIFVDDDGPGLDPSMRDVVLQRGVRADERGSGSGFGLAIVRDLAELHGGSIVVEGSPEGGVRARPRLPWAQHP